MIADDPRHCARCGAPITSDERFCGYCGLSIAREPVAGSSAEENLRQPNSPSAEPADSAGVARGTERVSKVSATSAAVDFTLTAASWTAGWLSGALLGAVVVAEMRFRHAMFVGLDFPGFDTLQINGSGDFRVLMLGIAPDGVLFWGLAGFAGGLTSAAVRAAIRIPSRSWSWWTFAAEAAMWSVAIAVTMNMRIDTGIPLVVLLPTVAGLLGVASSVLLPPAVASGTVVSALKEVLACAAGGLIGALALIPPMLV